MSGVFESRGLYRPRKVLKLMLWFPVQESPGKQCFMSVWTLESPWMFLHDYSGSPECVTVSVKYHLALTGIHCSTAYLHMGWPVWVNLDDWYTTWWFTRLSMVSFGHCCKACAVG